MIHTRDTAIVNMLSFCIMQINLAVSRLGFHDVHIISPLPPSDTVHWECHLAGTIVPDKCKLSVGKVRAELKLKKANLTTGVNMR